VVAANSVPALPGQRVLVTGASGFIGSHLAERLLAHGSHVRLLVRRAERETIGVASDGSYVVPYLNRLSDLLWALARWQDGTDHLLAKEA